MSRSVFVTGAYGLLGSWLVRALVARGDRVTVLQRDRAPRSALLLDDVAARVDVVHGDLVDDGLVARALGEYEVDTVFHLAAQTIVGTANRSPLATFESNVRGTWTLLEACRLHGVRARRRRRLRQGVRGKRDAALPRGRRRSTRAIRTTSARRRRT